MGWIAGKLFGLIVTWLAWTAGVTILTMLLRTELGDRPALVIALVVETAFAGALTVAFWRHDRYYSNEPLSKVAVLAMGTVSAAFFTGVLSGLGWMAREFVVSPAYRQILLPLAAVVVVFAVLAFVGSVLMTTLGPLVARGWRALLRTPLIRTSSACVRRTLWNGYGFIMLALVAVLAWIVTTDASIRVVIDRRTVLDILWGLGSIGGILVLASGGSLGVALVGVAAFAAAFVVPGAVWWLIAPHTRIGRRSFGDAYQDTMVFAVAGAFLVVPGAYLLWIVMVFAAGLAQQGLQTLLR